MVCWEGQRQLGATINLFSFGPTESGLNEYDLLLQSFLPVGAILCIFIAPAIRCISPLRIIIVMYFFISCTNFRRIINQLRRSAIFAARVLPNDDISSAGATPSGYVPMNLEFVISLFISLVILDITSVCP